MSAIPQPMKLKGLRLKRVSLVSEPACQENGEGAFVVLFKSDMTTGTRNNLPDSAFAAVWTDAQGNKQRKLPFKHADGSVDMAHLRNALSRLPQSDLPEAVKAKAKAKLEAAARSAGVGQEKSMKKDDDGDADDKSMEPEPGECQKCEKKLTKGAIYCSGCGEKIPKDMRKGAMNLDSISDPETRKAVEKMEADLKAATELLEEAGKAPAAKKDDVLKGLNDEQRALVEKLQKATEEAVAASKQHQLTLEKMEAERIEKGFIEKAATLKHLPGKPDDIGKMLHRVSINKSTKEDNEALFTLLKAANAAGKPMFTVVGRGASQNANTTQSASDEIATLAKDYIEKSTDAKKPTLEEARQAVIKDNPGLYEQYRLEAYARTKEVAVGDDE